MNKSASEWRVKCFEASNGLGTAPYKNIPLTSQNSPPHFNDTSVYTPDLPAATFPRRQTSRWEYQWRHLQRVPHSPANDTTSPVDPCTQQPSRTDRHHLATEELTTYKTHQLSEFCLNKFWSKDLIICFHNFHINLFVHIYFTNLHFS